MRPLLRRLFPTVPSGHPAESAMIMGEISLQISREIDDRVKVAQNLNLLGAANMSLDLFDKAVENFEEALGMFRDLDSLMNMGIMMGNLGELARLSGDNSASVFYCLESMRIAEEAGNRPGEMLARSNLGGARVGLGEYSLAEKDLREVIRMADKIGWGAWLPESCRFLAEALIGQGRFREACDAARQGLDFSLKSESQHLIGKAWCALGSVLGRARLHDASAGVGRDDPVECFEKSIDIFEETEQGRERGETIRAYAEYASACGDKERARELMERE